MNDFTGPGANGENRAAPREPHTGSGADTKTKTETRAKTQQGAPLSLTFTRRKRGGFIGKRLLSGRKIETLCAGTDFIDETVACTDFGQLAAAISERAHSGEWAISLGTPARNPSGPHRHEAADYIDAPARLFFIDFDGVFAKGLGRADKFEEGVVSRRRASVMLYGR
jgi:hypothetical protein